MNFDALKHVETLKKAGFPDDQATAQVRVLNEIIDSNLATKRDWKEMEQATRRDIKELEYKMKELEQRIIIKLGSLLTTGLVAIVALSKMNLI